jgi:hypothetical protein
MRTLCVMVKAPVMGRVKTRLGRDLGMVTALRAQRVMTAMVLRRLYRPKEWSLILAVAPDAEVRTPAFPGHLMRWPQGRGDLGRRMQRVFDAMRDHGPVVVIGADIPGIAPHDIRAAFAALEAKGAVIGPAGDGGYWLIGVGRRRRVTPFSNVRWSTAHAMADTLRNLQNGTTEILRTLPDIDTGGDWRAWERQPPSVRMRGI